MRGAKAHALRCVDGSFVHGRRRCVGTRFANPEVMALLLTATGRPLSRALHDGLTREGQSVWSPFTGSSLELVVAALGCRAIVYTAGASMLAGHLEPTPSPARARQVLLAAALPGVQLVVGIVPAGDEYVEEEELLKSGEVPSVILRCAPLVEELDADASWMTHGGIARVTTGEMLSSTVLRALEEASWHGQTVEVPTIRAQPGCRARRVTRPSLAVDPSVVPAFACLSGASWW